MMKEWTKKENSDLLAVALAVAVCGSSRFFDGCGDSDGVGDGDFCCACCFSALVDV